MNNKLALVFITCTLAGFSYNALATHNVHSYYRHDGTYVQSHKSMDPGESKRTGMSYHNDELVPSNDNSSHSYNSGFDN